MISTFQDYLQMKNHLTMNEMQTMQEQIAEEIGDDEEAQDIFSELITTAIKYTGIRAGWDFLSREEKMDRDPSRTSCHNSMIVKFNMLARYLKLQGKEASWRDLLGDEEADPMNRKRIGDFACYLVMVCGINAR